MTTGPETARGGFARTNSNYWKNLTAEDIPHGWMDDMVKRLFDELNRQMLRFENTGSTDPIDPDNPPTQEQKQGNRQNLTPAEREQESRTLARLEGTLNRLTKLEMQRASLRATKSARKRGDSRTDIAAKALAAVERAATRDRGGESQ